MKRAIAQAVKLDDLEEMRGWKRLEPQEKTDVRTEFRAIAEALHTEGQSRLAVGKHLSAVQSILSPKLLFASFLRRYFHMSRSTAFGYIDLYKAALNDSSKKVLDIAMSRNYRAINKPGIFKTYPPPKTDDPEKIVQYLDRLERNKSKVITIHKNPDLLLKDALRAIIHSWEKVPEKSKRPWMKTLLGMELTAFGIAHELVISPEAIPETLIAKPRHGRHIAA